MPDIPASGLSRPWLHILLALAERDRHGYAIMQEVEQRSDGTFRLWPATLYGAIRRMADAGLIQAVEAPNRSDDERRQYYHLTARGRRALGTELRRLEKLVELGRDRRLLGAPRSSR